MKNKSNRNHRMLGMFGVGVLCLVGYVLVGVFDVVGGEMFHVLLEIISVVAALVVGLMALVRFNAQKHNVLLFLSVGFLGAGLLDMYQVIVAGGVYGSGLFSGVSVFVPWSWNASRVYLGVMLVLSRWSSRAENDGRDLINPRVVLTLSTFVLLFLIGLMTVVDLPRVYSFNGVFSRPEEFLAGGLFLVVVLDLLVSENWKKHLTDYWTVLFLICSLFVQFGYMVFSRELYDGFFDVAHILKIFSYFLVFLGLLESTYNLFVRLDSKKEEELEKERARLNDLVLKQTAELKDKQVQLRRQQSALLNVLEDVSEEKKFEESQSRSILETITEGIVINEYQGVVSYVNPVFGAILGFSVEDLKGKVFEEAISAFDLSGKALSAESMSNSAAVTSGTTKLLIENKEKEKIAVMINAAPLYMDQQFKGVVRVIHDFSEEFKVQQQKDDFFSIASHELRTPLTVIAGNIDMVLDGYGKSELKPDDTELLQDVQTATDRLIKMVNSFLSVSRIDQGRLEANIKELDVCQLIKQVVHEIKPLFDEKGLYLKEDCGEKVQMIQADEGLLKEVVINLIGNSLKFTKTGGVEVGCAVEDSMVKIKVTDTGSGIDEDKQELLFQRFQQAMNRTLAREAGGTGLGLYISREFARLMGGDLVLLSSGAGKGSVFEVSLPISGPTANENIEA